MGPAPLPWDIPVNPGDKFIKKTVKLEVPHTASVKVINNLIFLQHKSSKLMPLKERQYMYLNMLDLFGLHC